MTCQRNNDETGYLLIYIYFKNYELITTDLNEYKVLDVDPGAIQQTDYTGSLDNDVTVVYIVETRRNMVEVFTRDCKSILKEAISFI